MLCAFVNFAIYGMQMNWTRSNALICLNVYLRLGKIKYICGNTEGTGLYDSWKCNCLVSSCAYTISWRSIGEHRIANEKKQSCLSHEIAIWIAAQFTVHFIFHRIALLSFPTLPILYRTVNHSCWVVGSYDTAAQSRPLTQGLSSPQSSLAHSRPCHVLHWSLPLVCQQTAQHGWQVKLFPVKDGLQPLELKTSLRLPHRGSHASSCFKMIASVLLQTKQKQQ